jgi:hypothetical protein
LVQIQNTILEERLEISVASSPWSPNHGRTKIKKEKPQKTTSEESLTGSGVTGKKNINKQTNSHTPDPQIGKLQLQPNDAQDQKRIKTKLLDKRKNSSPSIDANNKQTNKQTNNENAIEWAFSSRISTTTKHRWKESGSCETIPTHTKRRHKTATHGHAHVKLYNNNKQITMRLLLLRLHSTNDPHRI